MNRHASDAQPLGLSSCEFCGIGRVCFATHLMGRDLQELKPIVKRRYQVGKGESLHMAGQRFTGLCVLRSGSLKIVEIDQAGQECVIEFVLPGDMIGLEDVESATHTTDAIALEDCWVCEVPVGDLRERVFGDLALSRAMFSTLCQKVHQQRRRLSQLGSIDATHRVAGFLLDFSTRLRERQLRAERLRLTMDRRDIASYLGMTLETVSRSFSGLQKARFIRVRGKSVDLLDMDRMRQDYQCAIAA